MYTGNNQSSLTWDINVPTDAYSVPHMVLTLRKALKVVMVGACSVPHMVLTLRKALIV